MSTTFKVRVRKIYRGVRTGVGTLECRNIEVSEHKCINDFVNDQCNNCLFVCKFVNIYCLSILPYFFLPKSHKIQVNFVDCVNFPRILTYVNKLLVGVGGK